MSNRKESLKRRKRLDQATRGQTFERRYTMEGEDDERRGLSRYFWILIAIGIAAVLTAAIILWMFFGPTRDTSVDEPQVSEDPVVEATMPPVVIDESDVGEETSGSLMKDTATFLQGPKSWKNRLDWSGKWGVTDYDGRRFGGFGCGLCVMANLYTSFSPYRCSPVDMYEYAKQVTSYEGASAIDWPQIGEALTSVGFTVDVNRKPKKYKDFRDHITEAMGAIVVISSQYDDSYWQDTPGHYVTILGYDSTTDTIFLGDSGDPDHNRSWIPLRTVYKAIKKSNAYHYMRIISYDESRDGWRHEVIGGKWVQPSYWE